MERRPSTTGLRWGRALLAAIAVEIGLVGVAVVVSRLQADPTQALNWVTPPACLILFVPAGYWTARRTTSPMLNGLVAGVFGVLLYVAMTLAAATAVADFDLASSVRPAYLLAHGLKVVGGLVGGWLASRKLAPAPLA